MVKVLKSGSLVPSERMRSVHSVTPEAGTTLEEVMAPEYWRAVTPSLRAGDFIEVTAADGTYDADLRVRDVGMSWAKVKLHHVSHHKPNDFSGVPWDSVYEIGRNPTGPGDVLRLKSDFSIAGRFPDRDAAIAWAENKLRG